MKVRIPSRLQSISASKDEARVMVQGEILDVQLQPGTRSKLLESFGRGHTYVEVEVDAANPVVVPA